MTITEGKDNPKTKRLHQLHEAMVLCNEGQLICKQGRLCAEGDAVDCALLLMVNKAGLINYDKLKLQKQIDLIPYEPQQKYSAAIYQIRGQTYAYIKGASETVLDMCRYQLEDGARLPIDKGQVNEQEQLLTKKQLRVLAFASGPVDFKPSYQRQDFNDLTFLGLAGLGDPLRKEAKPAIEACHRAGIDVVMVTGDHPDTAFAIANALSLTHNRDRVVTGQKLQEASSRGEAALDELTSGCKVFARVAPGQKLEIVESLMRDGHFVAVTGDGVNDAPALRHAHVGVAMGRKGTDVARESAEIILTDDNFASIVSGIEEGRTAYANIRKIVFFLISTSIAEVIMFIGAMLLGLPVPLMATQLLWLNFATSIIQDAALAFDPPEGNELERPPRDPDESIFDQLMTRRIAFTASVMGLIALIEFYWMIEYLAYTTEQARNIVLLQFVLFENVIVLNSRSETHSFFSQPLMRNPLLIYGTLAAQVMHISAMYIPGLADVLAIQPVSLQLWALLILLALIPMVVIELEKAFRR